MTEVRYYCPRCGAVAALDREGYLADKCVTPGPLDGWEYADADDFEENADRGSADRSSGRSRRPDADGLKLVCGAAETDGEGCGEVYYLSFVKFEDGREVDPEDRSFVPPSVEGPAVGDATEDEDGPRFDFRP